MNNKPEDFPTYTHTHIRLTALFPVLPRWAGTRKVEPIWILLKQETVSGSGISWARCKSAPCSWQIATPASHHSVFYRPDALPAAQPTASKHWREDFPTYSVTKIARHAKITFPTVKLFPAASTKFREISSISRSNFKFQKISRISPCECRQKSTISQQNTVAETVRSSTLLTTTLSNSWTDDRRRQNL